MDGPLRRADKSGMLVCTLRVPGARSHDVSPCREATGALFGLFASPTGGP